MSDTAPAINLKNLRWSLLLLLAASLLSAAAVFLVQQLQLQVQQAHRQAEAQINETRQRLARAHDDEREIRSKIERYRQIVAQGRTQAERRLEWVETLGSIRTGRRLLGLDYEIAPQRPLDPKAEVTGGHSFLVSPMKLEMPLLHETDLLDLLDDLQAQVQALVSVRSCSIERLPAGRPSGANLKASCEIDWITLQEKS